MGYFWDRDMWGDDSVPEAMLRVLHEAARSQPDFVLLSEMGARITHDATRRVAAMVAERARQMRAYILLCGLDEEGQLYHAWL